MSQEKLNILPVPTFSHLGVNYAAADNIKFSTLNYTVKENEELSFLQIIDGKKPLETTVTLCPNSRLKIVQIFLSGEKAVSRLICRQSENSRSDIVQLFLNGNTISEVITQLKGENSEVSINIGYDLGKDSSLDVNLAAEHFGRKSISNTAVGGILRDNAQKIFKGTIDFKQGAVKAQGSEKEEVVLLSENAVNKTVPVILCAEEDVVGDHGATIGRIDERHIFYMKSRGIPEDKIYELISKGKLMRVIEKIEDDEAKRRIFGILGWCEKDELQDGFSGV